VRRAVLGADVGLDLDDPPDARRLAGLAVADQVGAEQPAGGLERRAREQVAREDRPTRPGLCQRG
jgi:hypothetical protein